MMMKKILMMGGEGHPGEEISTSLIKLGILRRRLLDKEGPQTEEDTDGKKGEVLLTNHGDQGKFQSIRPGGRTTLNNSWLAAFRRELHLFALGKGSSSGGKRA